MMTNIKTSVTELIGHTPMMELTHIEKELGLQAKIIAKLEYFNATGSVKDRIAKKNDRRCRRKRNIETRLCYH